MNAVMPLIGRLRQIVLIRYAIASVGALAVDMGTFLALLALLVPAVIASAIGYTAGIVAHWLLSSRKVFADSVASRGPERIRQKAMFVVSALVGLALTMAIVGAATFVGLDPRLAKLVAIIIAFAITWLMREKIVFARAASEA